jgi:hypothetical protein
VCKARTPAKQGAYSRERRAENAHELRPLARGDGEREYPCGEAGTGSARGPRVAKQPGLLRFDDGNDGAGADGRASRRQWQRGH